MCRFSDIGKALKEYRLRSDLSHVRMSQLIEETTGEKLNEKTIRNLEAGKGISLTSFDLILSILPMDLKQQIVGELGRGGGSNE